jgi:hypothetical protein
VSRRIATVLVGAAVPLLLTAPAFAGLDDGEVPGDSLGAGLVILYYVVIPLAIFGVIAFFSALPSMLRRPRYRPGRPWKHDPLWFGAPDDPDSAVADARPGASGRGGASAEW